MTRKVLLLTLVAGCLFMSLSCSGVPISTLSINDWDRTSTPSSTLSITYRFTNIGSVDIGRYGFCADVTSNEAGTEQYSYETAETVESGWSISRTASLTLNGPRTVTNVVKVRHWHYRL